MEIINEIITPLDSNKEIDIFTLNKLIENSLNNNNSKILLFSPMGDGQQLTIKEKEAIIRGINQNFISKIIFYFQTADEYQDNKVINILNNSDIEYVMINPPLGYNYSQNGLFLYFKNIIKKLKNKKIFLCNSPINNQTCFHFQTVKKLLKTNQNLIGLYENSNDFSLLTLIKQHFPTFKIFVNETHFEKSLKLNFDGIISLTSLIYGKDYKTMIDDYDHFFINRLLLDYLMLVHEILSFSNNSTLMKTYLKRLGYQSMEVRLPLVIDPQEIDNLDLLLP